MSHFKRHHTDFWQRQVPGTRWYRADLHIHTLDDHPNSNLRRPANVDGAVTDAGTHQSYAREFLKAAVRNNVQVLGLTPHAVRCGEVNDTSCVWRIVEEWNSGVDDDAVPFRDKIYAVFPGFEPSLMDGAAGIHLLFLFDPEIGREPYLRAFDAVMKGELPYVDGQLRNTRHDSKEVFAILNELEKSTHGEWSYICLAPHAFGHRGLFNLKSQVLEEFPHLELCGLELCDNQLIEDAHKDRPWLDEGLKRYRHCFYYSSDAYDVKNIGARFTLLKMGSPRIESLRQAFLAPDSRVRLPFVRGEKGCLDLSDTLPNPLALDRSWLRRVHIRGGTSFFRSHADQSTEDPGQVFELSPDLTCIIGGRMSGKSTFLDGLRAHVGLPLPTENSVREDVEARARERFLSGGAQCDLDICGPIAHTESLPSRWPAKFYTQRELQAAVRDQNSRRRLLYRLLPETSDELIRLDEDISRDDKEIDAGLTELERLRNQYLADEQEFERVERARDALTRFRDAGSDDLSREQANLGRLTASLGELDRQGISLSALFHSSKSFEVPTIESTDLGSELTPPGGPSAESTLRRYRASLRLATALVGRLNKMIAAAASRREVIVDETKAIVQRRLVEAGGTSEDLNQFDALTATAAEYESLRAKRDRSRSEYGRALRAFGTRRRERETHVGRRRELMNQLAATIGERFEGRIRLLIRSDGSFQRLDDWIRALKNQGVSRWWNERSTQDPSVTPQELRSAIRHHRRCAKRSPSDVCRLLINLGMSTTVATTFASVIDDTKLIHLSALRNEDRYDIEMRTNETPPTYKEMGKLSGGAQVSILLSLILQSNDSTPLVIDQPEDEIDKEFLFDTVLPALRRLKGRRQVIFATHDANIVVNGDADHVIHLRAHADAGRIAVQGVIETREVRDAIVGTLDGGRDAFTLRKDKYGF